MVVQDSSSSKWRSTRMLGTGQGESTTTAAAALVPRQCSDITASIAPVLLRLSPALHQALDLPRIWI
jgi:hypothetical protein